mgnify:CR=1 FL=1
MFENSVGRIRPAKATSGGKKDENAEIMIIGMAKPTAPLTNPANRVIAIAAQNACGDKPAIRNSMPAPLFAPCIAKARGACTAKTHATLSIFWPSKNERILRCNCEGATAFCNRRIRKVSPWPMMVPPCPTPPCCPIFWA